MAPGYWQEILSTGLAVPDDRPLDDLTAELTRMLGSPDPEQRDGTAYPALSTWIDRGVYDDLLSGLGGKDTLSGGAGRDQFVYTSMIDAGDSITDFTPADDLLDLGQLMRALGIASANPLASGHVVCSNATGAAVIGINAAGSGALTRSRPLSYAMRPANVSSSAVLPAPASPWQSTRKRCT